MGIIYEIKIPAISIQIEAKDKNGAMKEARYVLKKIVVDQLMKSKNWKEKSSGEY